MKTTLIAFFALAVSSGFAQCVAPADPVANTLQVPCGSAANFVPQGGGNYFWYNNAAADSMIAIASNYSIPSLTADTTLGVQEYSLGSSTTIPGPGQSSTFSGNVRGYYFISPVRMMITGVAVPTDASSGNQSIAIVKFNANPPLYSGTTNSFTTLFLVQDGSATGTFPLNILVEPGDIIGVLGSRAGVCSYGAGNLGQLF